jgi:hypothetical protein
MNYALCLRRRWRRRSFVSPEYAFGEGGGGERERQHERGDSISIAFHLFFPFEAIGETRPFRVLFAT